MAPRLGKRLRAASIWTVVKPIAFKAPDSATATGGKLMSFARWKRRVNHLGSWNIISFHVDAIESQNVCRLLRFFKLFASLFRGFPLHPVYFTVHLEQCITKRKGIWPLEIF